MTVCPFSLFFPLSNLLAGSCKYYWLDITDKKDGWWSKIPLNFESDLDHPRGTKVIWIFPIYLFFCALAEVCAL